MGRTTSSTYDHIKGKRHVTADYFSLRARDVHPVFERGFCSDEFRPRRGHFRYHWQQHGKRHQRWQYGKRQLGCPFLRHKEWPKTQWHHDAITLHGGRQGSAIV
jgi:hypothetical protein